MIYKEPLPLLEAHFFLANRTIGFSWEQFLAKCFTAEPRNPANEKLHEYESILKELTNRLESSIEVDDDTLNKLYRPFRNKEQDFFTGSFAANLLIPGTILEACAAPDNEFINIVEEFAPHVPTAVYRKFGGHTVRDAEPVGIEQVVDTIMASDLDSDNKLLLIDLSISSKKYTGMLIRSLLPVAAEYRRCGDIIKPLLDLYAENYEGCTAESVLRRILNETDDSYNDFTMYPLVTYANVVTVGSDIENPSRLFGCVGTLYDFFHSNYSFDLNSVLKLADIMFALGSRNRLTIIERLIERDSYGRELSEYLKLSPATISQHIVILVNAGLVNAHTDGYRAYYSLNTGNIRQFIDRLRELFSPVLDDAKDKE